MAECEKRGISRCRANFSGENGVFAYMRHIRQTYMYFALFYANRLTNPLTTTLFVRMYNIKNRLRFLCEGRFVIYMQSAFTIF